MRKLITGLFVAGMSFGALEAQAAQESWKCIGAAYVCGEPASKSQVGTDAPVKYVSNKNYAKKYSTSAKKRNAKSYQEAAATSSRGSMTGQASYYWQPQRVASGGWFNPNAMTAAHKTLPFGTKVRVTNQRNGRSVVVKINDRGPYVKGRIIDLSKAAAHSIGMQNSGVAPVSLEVLGKS
jgi:rare lipoprotein A